MINSGKQIQPKKITINLAPADMKKEGPSFDLPIAAGVLTATGQLVPAAEFPLDRTILFGELSLDGKVRAVHGALPMVISAKECGYRDVILPEDNAQEVACIEGMRIFQYKTLKEVIEHIEVSVPVMPQQQITYDELCK